MKNILILAIVLICGFVSISINIKGIKTVEKFCSIKHQHNVEEYKVCKKLGTNDLIIKLTKEEQNKYESLVPLINVK